MSVVIGPLWVACVLAIGFVLRPVPVRRPFTAPPFRRPNFALVAVGRTAVRVAAGLCRVGGVEAPDITDGQRLSRIGTATIAVGGGLAASPPLGAALVLLWVARHRAARRRRARQRAATIARELPDAVELLAIAISSGANLTQAVDITVANLEGIVADALRSARQATLVGRRMVDALALLPDDLGPEVQPLVTALVLAERHGTPLVQALRQLALELRDQRRRSAEEAARRVPIRLLAPLVLLLLPAFALLTVAPLLAGGLRSLSL